MSSHGIIHYLYSNPSIKNDYEAVEGLYKCIERLSENEDFVDIIHREMSAAIRKRVTVAPIEWWKMYGAHTPHLQYLAIKVLQICLKKRNRLEHQNFKTWFMLILQEGYECHDVIDPIDLNDIDDSKEWIMGCGHGEDTKNDLVLFMIDVANASEVGEPLQYTRRQTKMKWEVVASTPRKEKGMEMVGEEDETSEDEGEEEIYNSNTSKSDEEDMNLEEDEDSY
ncbi:hypothetical protein CR513_38811, partial [Mucuna pruriens]